MNDPYTELLELVQDSPSLLEHSYRVPRPVQEAGKIEIRLPTKGAAIPADSRTGRADASSSFSRNSTFQKTTLTVPMPADLADLAGSDGMDQLVSMIRTCTKCELCSTRTKAVPGTGSLHPLVMVIGEGPGADEDRLGLPFVGAAGQFLDKWLEAIGLSRYQNTFITNTVKCRPPQNRDPLPEETSTCSPYLATQIRILKPKAILTVGRFAASFLAGDTIRIGEVHGQFFDHEGTPWMPTYHPSAVLRDPSLKRLVWEDLKNFKASLLDTKDASGA